MNEVLFLEKLESILKRVLKKDDPKRLSMDTNLMEEWDLDSLSAMEILVHIEMEFDIEVDDDDLSMKLLETPENLWNYIIEREKVND
jgi:acyl carrier protein